MRRVKEQKEQNEKEKLQKKEEQRLARIAKGQSEMAELAMMANQKNKEFDKKQGEKSKRLMKGTYSNIFKIFCCKLKPRSGFNPHKIKFSDAVTNYIYSLINHVY